MSDLEGLLAVQELDTRIDQLRHRLAHLPERRAVAEVDEVIARLEAARGGVQGRLDDVRRDQRRLEGEVAAVEEKAAQVDDQLYGGSITSPKELEALQHELEGLRRRQRELEDRVLEQMEVAEPLDAELADLDGSRREAAESLTVARAELDAAVAVVEAELATVEEERRSSAAALPDDLLEAYEAIRARRDGVGAARLEGDRCAGCHLTLPSADAESLRRSPPDEVVHCPECGRILVR